MPDNLLLNYNRTGSFLSVHQKPALYSLPGRIFSDVYKEIQACLVYTKLSLHTNLFNISSLVSSEKIKCILQVFGLKTSKAKSRSGMALKILPRSHRGNIGKAGHFENVSLETRLR